MISRIVVCTTTLLVVVMFPGVLAGADAAVDAELRAKLRWRPAPAPTVAVDRGHLLSGPPLEEIIAPGKKPPAKSGPAQASAKKSQVVVEGERLPLRYRRTIRRYFVLIHAKSTR
jgi:hypothetical protein